jgi:hypothetical protein
MTPARTTVAKSFLLVVGMFLGWIIAGGRTPTLFAHGGDRRGESALLTGPISTEHNERLKVQITNDAIYYLNYSKGLLLTAVPSSQQTSAATNVLSEFAERDLVQDFQLSAQAHPHFLMTTGTMGALSDGWAPLYVFETTTGQVGIYRVIPQATATSTKPVFQLLERKRADPRIAEFR